MGNGAGFIPFVFLLLALVLDRASVTFKAGGAPMLGRAVERAALFLLIAGAVTLGTIWSPLR